MKKIYYYLKLENISPIHIGSGESENTDLDIIKDREGRFFIPGTSIAGSIMHSLTPDQQLLLNPMIDDQHKQSILIINDARMITNDFAEVRDGIALDDDKIIKHTNKYDYEVIPRGNQFELCIELNQWKDKDSYETVMQEIFSSIQNHDIKIGYKTTRGLGRLKIIKAGIKKFDRTNFNDYFTFDRYNIDHYDLWKMNETKTKKYIHLTAKLKLRQGISIRTYHDLESDIDYEHIHSKQKAIIPATSWNGLLRKSVKNYIEQLGLSMLDISDIFGNSIDNPKDKKRSKISIEESIIEGGMERTYIRNRIDPFHAGTVQGTLYNEQIHYLGTTNLSISLSKNIDHLDLVIQLLVLFLKDLDQGFIALGGETNIGRGLFKVEEIDQDGDKIQFNQLMEELVC